jgi:hypothetical protein
MRRLIAIARILAGGIGHRDRLGQASAGRQRPAAGHGQTGMHEHVVVGHALSCFGDRGIRGIRLTQLGVGLCQCKATCWPQTGCDAVFFSTGQRLMQKLYRGRDLAACQLRVALQECKVRVGKTGHVTCRLG